MKAILLIFFAGLAVARAAETTGLDAARLALGKWVETQQIIAKEKREWQQGKEILSARVELVNNEIHALEEKLKRTAGQTTDVDQQKQELVSQNETLKSVAGELGSAVAGLETQVRQLFKILPEPIQQKLGPLYDRIPADPAHTKVSLAERFQNVLGILNEVNKLNGEITLVSETRTLANGKPAEVKTIYVGLGQAYFLSAQGEAGIGRPTAEGWQWQAANNLANDLMQVIEILQNKAHPKFVSLPVKIQ